jgi:hypothetical protein
MISNDILHHSFTITSTSQLENVAVLVHKTQHQKLRIVSGYIPPNKTLRHEDVKDIFNSPTPTVLLGDFNCKHVAWKCASINRNGKILIDVCTEQAITIYAPTQATYFPPRGLASVLDIILAEGCILSPPQAISALSSDHNTVIYKIRVTPKQATHQPHYDYKSANWIHHRLLLDNLLHTRPRIHGEQDLDRTVHSFTASLLLAAESSIPKRHINTFRPSLPPSLCSLIRIQNYVRRRYQRTRHKVLWRVLQLLNRLTATYLNNYRNIKWASFLRTLHPHKAPIWRVVRYFAKRRVTIPPLFHRGTQYYEAENKADLLAQRFEANHRITTPQQLTTHARAVDRMVEKFCKDQGQVI